MIWTDVLKWRRATRWSVFQLFAALLGGIIATFIPRPCANLGLRVRLIAHFPKERTYDFLSLSLHMERGDSMWLPASSLRSVRENPRHKPWHGKNRAQQELNYQALYFQASMKKKHTHHTWLMIGQGGIESGFVHSGYQGWLTNICRWPATCPCLLIWSPWLPSLCSYFSSSSSSSSSSFSSSCPSSSFVVFFIFLLYSSCGSSCCSSCRMPRQQHQHKPTPGRPTMLNTRSHAAAGACVPLLALLVLVALITFLVLWCGWWCWKWCW